MTPTCDREITEKCVCRCAECKAELKRKAAQLNENERAELALALIESLDGEADVGVEEAWQIEVSNAISRIAAWFCPAASSCSRTLCERLERSSDRMAQ
ncbi:MAG: hypothetical protein DYH14_13740 [Betaproteobacteria bacterium PRO3]|nr:hypothetical protein [Betaproteobacteria bacterium PRO3]